MKHSIIKPVGVVAVIPAVGLATVAVIVSTNLLLPRESEVDVRAMAAVITPADYPMNGSSGSYWESHCPDSGRGQFGLITLGSGETVEFWFMPHGLYRGGDPGGTLFRFANGDTRFMSGYSCCEQELPKVQPINRAALTHWIRDHNGLQP